jgi:DNA-binding winged helix-turn-helix (wHTH) protein
MRYVFGDCILDTQRYELCRAGVQRALRPKVFQVLAYLLAHRDRLVRKQELLEQLWPGQFISEATLNSCILAVRKALGEGGRTPRYVQTVHGQGYRFVAPVVEQAPLRADAAAAPSTTGTPSPHAAHGEAMLQERMVRAPLPEPSGSAEEDAPGPGWPPALDPLDLPVTHIYSFMRELVA